MTTDKQIEELKNDLVTEKEALEQRIKHDQETVTEQAQTDFSGEISSYDNHPGDLGTELFDKERYQAIDDHGKEELERIETALKAMDEGTYGQCKECGEEIPFDRLKARPSTLYCIEHTPEQRIHEDTFGERRPVEEEVLIPSQGDSFENRRKSDDRNNVKEDSFGEAAKYGTSETPADYRGDHEDYNNLYKTEDETEAFPEEYEGYAANDIDGKNRKIIRNDNEEEYEEMLDEDQIDSQIGDIPYKKVLRQMLGWRLIAIPNQYVSQFL
ncbi:TraR/DksA C4-type zinc finger protein [Bacillus massiliglaciei]|uniref:TraR/DksA C4-type zinc finger protein n=1 Tax=Bacillus massiliglaciei TaxID=1816693 RepID=UPI000A5CB413|nr:TraR/DksA C4-type zinc finger protein [Bacillus massiliglaciei]